MHLAAKSGREATVQLLLEKETGIDAKSSSGQTALNLAADNGYEATTLLLREPTSSKYLWIDNTTPGGQRRRKAVVQLMLGKGPNDDAKDNSRWTALRLATERTIIKT